MSPEHESLLMDAVRDLTCDTSSKEVFTELLLTALEDISGFEVMDEARTQQIVNYFWSKYRGKKTD
ncbi:hypothetical protein JI739_24135 [Ramlibacter sp. AW1]|uniref:Uncharacterized protein n=1 Tax=Ramlibacter aurantiacus TaxID=2801330 RepID=A0A936ZLE7_9BURK|nr:hypothetical protein [Ramlibacter aurantiacus]MBL0423444.1 hypothetical protein [Ramlibacter aurantiacus]